MEQCLAIRAASSVTRIQFALAGALLLAWSQWVYASPQLAERDYVLPAEVHGGYIYTPSTTQGSSSANQKQSTVNYKAFDGSSYVLQPHAGRFVTLLLPTTAGSTPFTADHIEELIDRLDILYSTYRDLMQGEPSGSGSLNIAFVNETCGLACGYIGSKGIEIKAESDNYETLIRDLEKGELSAKLTHEMAHNFDIFSNYLHYLPDHGHAWTAMFEYFAPYRFARESRNLQPADDLYQSPSNTVWKSYIEDATANWEKCVRDQQCHAAGFTENHLWAMIYYRIEALHGVNSVQQSFAYLKSYAKSNTPPKTTQQKEDLRLMSLAVGANVNISCYLETLKWSISPTLASDLQKRFGNGGTNCNDNDKDGYSIVTGDCDDNNAARSPGQKEVQGNRIDDDCDDVADELMVLESSTGDLPAYSATLSAKKLPLEVQAGVSNTKDRDAVRFNLPANGRVEAKLCAQNGFSGWLTALQANGQFLDSDFWFEHLDVTGCSTKVFDFGVMTTGQLEVQADKSTGQYSLTITAAEDEAEDFSSLLKVVPRPAGGMNVVVSDPQGKLSELGASELEVWISGQAHRLKAPYTAQTTIQITASSAPGLASGAMYQARIRPLKNGNPLAAFSAGHLFRYDSGATAPAQLDGGYSGAWFDPSHSGEGFAIEVNDNGGALAYWFTYNASGEQRWMLGVGEVQGNTLVFDELLSTHGGRFGNNFDPDDVEIETIGSLSITFLDCNRAIANYSLGSNGDHLVLDRLSSVHGHPCGQASQMISLDLSGSWFDPDHSGEGFVVQQIAADQALVYWFSYDRNGEQAWMFNTGLIEHGTIETDEVLQTSGGVFGRSFDSSAVGTSNWGSLEIQLDCGGGLATYKRQAPGFSNGSQQLEPLTRLNNSGCSR